MMEVIALTGDLNEQLADLTPEQLDNVERAAARLAEEKRRQQRIETNAKNEITDTARSENGVPAKATVVVKTINDNEYEYWQWRSSEDGKVSTRARWTILSNTFFNVTW